MGHGHKRKDAPDHRHDLACSVPGRVHDNIRDNVFAVVRRDAPAPVGQLREGRHAGKSADRRAEIASALRQSLGQLRRVDIAVVRVPKRALKVIESDERVLAMNLVRRKDFVVHRIGSRHGADVLELVHSLPRVSEPDRANDVVVDWIAYFVAQPAVELG